jgi:hypothetical protein
MNDSLTMTIIIRGPAYRELVSQLSVIVEPRDRAALLKRLAEDGMQTFNSRVAVMTDSVGLSGGAGSDPRRLDIRLVIRRDEFPLLHGVLLQCANPRARAARFRQLAYEGARRRQVPAVSGVPGVPQQSAVPGEPDPGEAKTRSIGALRLDPGSIPRDLFSGFGSG